MNILDLNRMATAMAKAKEVREEIERANPIVCQQRFDDDFERVFGAGDERKVIPVSINNAMYDAGHKPSDF